MSISQWLPCLEWGRHYDRTHAAQDGLAALIVTLMLIPQSLAYAMLAGLPPVSGLYASLLPLLLYAVFGSSRTLAVGPVAVVSLMTAAALQPLFPEGGPAYAGAALLLALMSGLILYETSNIINGGETNYVMATVTLFVSIFNLFTSLLHLLGFANNE